MVQCYECGTVYPETMRCCPNCGSEAKIQLAPNSCVALVLMCVFPPLSILGIVFSTLGLSQIKKSFQRGKGLAVAGLTIGMITTVFSIFLYAMVFIESLW